MLDEATMSEEDRARIKENRKYYANKQGRYLKSWDNVPEIDGVCKQAMRRSSPRSPTMTSATPQEVGLWFLPFATP